MPSTHKIQKQSNLIFDVGMHKGEDTSFYLKKGYTVIGFEANPDLAAECRIKFANEIEQKQLIIIEGAIVNSELLNNKSNTVSFFKNKDLSIWGTVVAEWAKRNERLNTSIEIIEVQPIDFKEYLIKYGIPYYLKIDIEGMDKVCLEALLECSEKPDYISIESEKTDFKKLKEEIELLNTLGYVYFKAINQANITKQKLPKKTNQGNEIDHFFESRSSGLFGTDLPDNWKTMNKVIIEYKWIFLGYKLFGDQGLLRNFFLGDLIFRLVNKFSRSPIPGWHDIHAKHISTLEKFK